MVQQQKHTSYTSSCTNSWSDPQVTRLMFELVHPPWRHPNTAAQSTQPAAIKHQSANKKSGKHLQLEAQNNIYLGYSWTHKASWLVSILIHKLKKFVNCNSPTSSAWPFIFYFSKNLTACLPLSLAYPLSLFFSCPMPLSPSSSSSVRMYIKMNGCQK